MRNSKYTKIILIALLWLIIWEVVSLCLHNEILLVGPTEVLVTLARDSLSFSFWKSIFNSLFRIGTGFISGVALGLLLGVLSWKWKILEDVLKPFVAFLKAAPVASFVVLFLIWWHSDVLSIAICICVVLPQIYVSVLQGLNNTDGKMLEMADIFKVHPVDRLHYIYRPSVRPYLEGAIKISAGMAWKSGVAAEVIGTPDATIGEALYMSKIYLDTAGVLAWTVAIIIISGICERIILKLYALYNSWEPGCIKRVTTNKSPKDTAIELMGLCRTFDDKKVIDNLNIRYEANNIYELNEPSGSGKTTLLRLIAGLEKEDAGKICIFPDNAKVSMLFQEDRLVEEYSAIKNVAIACGSEEDARWSLLKLLDEDKLKQPVKNLSGGERRRVCIARALSKPGDILLLDEPYNGLDDVNRKKACDYIESVKKGRVVIVASHI